MWKNLWWFFYFYFHDEPQEAYDLEKRYKDNQIKALVTNPTVRMLDMTSKKITIDALMRLMIARKLEFEVSPFVCQKSLVATIRINRPFRSVFHFDLNNQLAILTTSDKMLPLIESLKLDCQIAKIKFTPLVTKDATTSISNAPAPKTTVDASESQSSHM